MLEQKLGFAMWENIEQSSVPVAERVALVARVAQHLAFVPW